MGKVQRKATPQDLQDEFPELIDPSGGYADGRPSDCLRDCFLIK